MIELEDIIRAVAASVEAAARRLQSSQAPVVLEEFECTVRFRAEIDLKHIEKSSKRAEDRGGPKLRFTRVEKLPCGPQQRPREGFDDADTLTLRLVFGIQD